MKKGSRTHRWMGPMLGGRTHRSRILGRLAAGLVIAASCFARTTSMAASAPAVKGKVVGWEKLFPQQYVEATKSDAHRYTWREPSPTVKQDFRKLSANVSRDVCVVAVGSGTAAPHEPLSIKLTGGRLTPSTIVLSVGSRLSFKNVDPFPHILFEAGNDKWGPNSTGPGSTREWAATTPGVHVIRDQLFPSVVMSVVVDAGATDFALPDRDGAFSLSLPAGEYALKVFFGGKQVSKDESIKVGDRGLELKEPISLAGDSK